jgi:hypothetical protein
MPPESQAMRFAVSQVHGRPDDLVLVHVRVPTPGGRRSLVEVIALHDDTHNATSTFTWPWERRHAGGLRSTRYE